MSYQNLTDIPVDTTRLSAKGQVVLPKRVRDDLGWKPGTEFIVVRSGEGVTLTPMRAAGAGSIKDLAGALRHRGKPVTLRQMDEAVANEARKPRGRD